MSLYGAMMLGIDGLDANSNALSIYSSNIANVNTIGYKDVGAAFSTMLTQMFGGIDQAGVSTTAMQNNTQQGLLQQASSPTDLAISGQGFFTVSANEDGSGTPLYTRAGNFSENADGYLQNGAGFYLQGWPIQSDGTVNTGTALSGLNLNGLSSPPVASTIASIVGNLNSNSTLNDFVANGGTYYVGAMSENPPTVTPDFTTTVNFTDSQGNTQPVTVNFIENSPNNWSYEIDYAGKGSITANGFDAKAPDLLAAGKVSFNSDGSLNSMQGFNFSTSTYSPETNIPVSIPFTSGPAVMNVVLSMGTPGGNGTSGGGTDGFTQYASNSVLTSSTVNGEGAGTVTGFSVDKNGIVTANFSNGQTKNVFQIPLATFADANGLTATSGDAWTASAASGSAIYDAPNTGAAGAIQSGALEGSTVDLATEFTNLITSQRAYSASARIITTADTMLQTLEQLPST
jgi:flagellar hook protein FlgE